MGAGHLRWRAGGHRPGENELRSLALPNEEYGTTHGRTVRGNSERIKKYHRPRAGAGGGMVVFCFFATKIIVAMLRCFGEGVKHRQALQISASVGVMFLRNR